MAEPLLAWLGQAPAASRKALLAASLGWMLDSFDVMLYALVLASLIAEFHMSKGTAGVLGSITLVAAALGGMVFGVVADRVGRTRALMASVLIYAVFTAACGLAHSVVQLAVFRVLLGFGMGGEWASGASLVSESFPLEDRGKALGLMQSAWAIGYGLAALVVWVVLPRYGWRAVFFVGILPAFITLWIRRSVEEPVAWRAAQKHASGGTFRALFARPLLVLTLGLTTMNACCLFAWWGFNLWVPAYLSLAPAKGGVGVASGMMTAIVVFMQVGMWLGVRDIRLHLRSVRPRAHVCGVPGRGGRADAGVWRHARAVGAVWAGAVCGVCGDGLLQRVRGRDGGCVRKPHPRDGTGLHLQHGPHCERGGAVPGRVIC